jgi:hypothetical protein
VGVSSGGVGVLVPLPIPVEGAPLPVVVVVVVVVVVGTTRGVSAGVSGVFEHADVPMISRSKKTGAYRNTKRRANPDAREFPVA